MLLLDRETEASERPEHHRDELRLWLRMLACTNLIEAEIRRRLRERFDVTLPRFDLMAQLDRAPDGLTLSTISRRMMVSNGNVTGLVDRLVESGHLQRRASVTDRRSHLISLTTLGRREFRAMAAAHEGWIAEIFAGLPADESEALMRLLAKTKRSAARAAATDTEPVR